MTEPFTPGGTFGGPFYEGGGTSNLVTAKIVEAALGGHGYRINWDSEVPLKYFPVEIHREQFDSSDSPGEQSINPLSLWRRLGESWHIGAGQEHFDRKESNEFRFDESQGVNIWEKWKLTLLQDVVQKSASANTNLRFAVAGTHMYWADGTSLRYLTDLAGAITDLTGEPGTAPSSIVSDGFNVWSSHGASGIYKTTRGAASTASHITGSTGLLAYVRNRVLATSLDGRSIYDVTTLAMGGGGALPAALYTHSNTDFDFVSFAECVGYIYAAGFSGDKSLLYKFAVKEDGTGLDQPSVAAELPEGEVVTHINGYLGRFVFIGTTKGWRLGVVTGNGDLSIGAFVATPASVLCSEGQEEFIWYGLSNFTASHTGLGRLSTAKFSDFDNLVPAYASDLMVSGSIANVLSVITFQGKRVFSVSGLGIYYESDNCIPEGYVDSGRITYGITEPKVGLWMSLAHEGEFGSFEILISVDNGAFVSIGERLSSDNPAPVLGVGEVSATTFEIRIRLLRDVLVPEECPTLLSWLFRVQPKPETTELIETTVFLAPELETMVDSPQAYDTQSEKEFIKKLYKNKTVTTWQAGRELSSVIVESYEFMPSSIMEEHGGLIGQNLDAHLMLKVAD